MSRRTAPTRELTDREFNVLSDIGWLRFMSGSQIARTHFHTGTLVGRQRRCQAILKRLSDEGYLHRLGRRVGGEKRGSARFIYQLGFRGQRLVFPSRRARTPAESGAMFVEHSLAVAEIVTQLIEAKNANVCQQISTVCEPQVWRNYLGLHGVARTLKPDLEANVETSDSEQLMWFIEVDRDTESLKRIRSKANQYLEYWRTGSEQQRGEVFPRVLWSVPNDKRRNAIARTLSELPDPASAMFIVTTAAETKRQLLSTDRLDNASGGGAGNGDDVHVGDDP